MTLTGNYFHATIAAVSLFSLTSLGRSLFTIANNFDLAARGAIHNQVIEYAIGTSLTQRQVVFTRSTLVSMTFQANTLVRVGCQVAGMIRQCLAIFCFEFCDIEVKVEHSLTQGVLRPDFFLG